MGVATVFDAIGAFLASQHHLYSAYGLFLGAIALASVAIIATYLDEYRIKQGKEQLGRILVELSGCERTAYSGTSAKEYDQLNRQIENIKYKIGEIGKKYFDSSVESRFLAVNVLDVQLDEATKGQFLLPGRGEFWPMYQQIKGWRIFLDKFLQELRR